jgi:hypothetical protein
MRGGTFGKVTARGQERRRQQREGTPVKAPLKVELHKSTLGSQSKVLRTDDGMVLGNWVGKIPEPTKYCTMLR